MNLITRLFSVPSLVSQDNDIEIGLVGVLIRDTYTLTKVAGDVVIPSGSIVIVTSHIGGGEWVEVLALEQRCVIHLKSLVDSLQKI